MKISVMNARAIAAALTKGADDAMAKGEHEFDLLSTVQSIDDAARADLEQAIAEAKQNDQG